MKFLSLEFTLFKRSNYIHKWFRIGGHKKDLTIKFSFKNGKANYSWNS